jgi:Na+/proline symporter
MDQKTLTKVILTVLVLVYILFGDNTPKWIAMFVYSGFGVLLLLVLCGYLLLKQNKYLAVLAIIFTVVLLYRVAYYNFPISTQATKDAQLMSYNKVPYTLEQQIVKLRLPSSDFNVKPDSFGYNFKPAVDNTHNASPV